MGWKLRALFLSASMLLATACSGERQSALPDPVRVAANSAGAPAEARGERIEGNRYVVRFAEAGEEITLVLAADGGMVQRQETLSYRPKPAAPDAFLSGPASNAEDFVDAVLRGETAKYRERGQALVDGIAAVQSRMNPARYDLARTHAAAAMAALQRNEATPAALEALEAYRVLEESSAAATRATPIEVSLLDYAGFKIAAHAQHARLNWNEAEAAVRFSGEQWRALRAQVKDSAVSDMMDELQRALSAAARSRDSNTLGAAARAQLAAVDLVERYFEREYKTGAGATPPLDQD